METEREGDRNRGGQTLVKEKETAKDNLMHGSDWRGQGRKREEEEVVSR